MYKLKIKLLTSGARVPVKTNKTDAGNDLCADFSDNQFDTIQGSQSVLKLAYVGEDGELVKQVVLPPMAKVIIPFGIAIKVEGPKADDELFESQVRPRSGLAAKFGITVLNSPGTVDESFRGEVKGILFNLGTENFIINHGDRVAQLVVKKTLNALTEVVEELDETERGAKGFGDSGVQ